MDYLSTGLPPFQNLLMMSANARVTEEVVKAKNNLVLQNIAVNKSFEEEIKKMIGLQLFALTEFIRVDIKGERILNSYI